MVYINMKSFSDNDVEERKAEHIKIVLEENMD